MAYKSRKWLENIGEIYVQMFKKIWPEKNLKSMKQSSFVGLQSNKHKLNITA